MEKSSRLRVGLVGTGRLGHLYAQYLSTQVPRAQLVAIAGHSADEVGSQWNVPLRFRDRSELIQHPDVEAVIIVSSTDTHVQFIGEALSIGKPTFCEKPLSQDLVAAEGLLRDAALLISGGHRAYFQMGFMRRFDPHYVEAKRVVDSGKIGAPRFFRAISRDKERPSMDYLRTSGGIIMDMAIHDLDLARWFMGKSLCIEHCYGDRLFYPEIREVDDVDLALITFRSDDGVGGSGVIEASRRGAYGYDIMTEIVGTEGAVRVGYLHGQSVTVMTDGAISHNTMPGFMDRFEASFVLQLRNFVDNVLDDKPSPCTLSDGIESLRLAVDAQHAMTQRGLVL